MAKFSKCTLRNKDFLKNIFKLAKCKKLKPELKKHVLNATKDQINSITEIAVNTLRGNIPFTKRAKNKLQQHKESIRALAKPKLPLKKRKELITQEGGFLPALLTPIIVSLASELIRKYV